MSKKLVITILTDKDSWMNRYNVILKNQIEQIGHKVNLIHLKEDLTHGDIAFFLSCSTIIPKSCLNLSEHNIVVHGSDLPKGKGWSPVSWQILEGKNEIPLSLFEATNSVDSGRIYYKDVIKLSGTELVEEWRNILGLKIIELCLKFISEYKNNLVSQEQNGEGSFYPKRSPKDSELDIDKTIREQINLLRICDNNLYPAFFYYKEKKFILHIKQSEA